MKNLFILLFVFGVSCVSKNERAFVTNVYPSSDTVPSNLLRMYVQFSEPMKTVGNLERIKLVDENGEKIPGALFNNVYELWDDRQTQLTLIFDPARVKTGLEAHEQLGRALESGKSYSLMVGNLETINHQEIASFSKNLYVTPADTTPPTIQSWNINVPKAKSSLPINVSIPQAADWMSLLHRIHVINEEGKKIAGTIEISNHEQTWGFIPIRKWEKGDYFLIVNTRFADPSGNNLNGLFDHRVGSLKFESEGEIIQVPFSIVD